MRRVLELRAGGAQAAVKKIGALLARAGTDDRIRGAFRYHGASTGRWAGEGYQPQNLKRPEVEDLDAAIAAVMTGDYALMKQLYPKPLSVVGDCSRAMITAADDHELIGADLSSIESRVAAWVAGEEWKLDTYRKYDETGDPRDEPYCMTACKIFGVPRRHLRQELARTQGRQDLRSGVSTMPAASVPGAISILTGSPTKRSRRSSRSGARRIRRSCGTGTRSIAAAVKAVYEPGVEIVCGPVVLKSDGKFLRIRLPSGRDLCYPNPRLICRRSRQRAASCTTTIPAAGLLPAAAVSAPIAASGLRTSSRGISRDILVEAMFRIEAAGYPIVLHVHDEVRLRGADRFWQRAGIRLA